MMTVTAPVMIPIGTAIVIHPARTAALQPGTPTVGSPTLTGCGEIVSSPLLLHLSLDIHHLPLQDIQPRHLPLQAIHTTGSVPPALLLQVIQAIHTTGSIPPALLLQVIHTTGSASPALPLQVIHVMSSLPLVLSVHNTLVPTTLLQEWPTPPS